MNGIWRENCYIVANAAGDALIVDPGSDADAIAGLIDRNGWRVHGIVNTHAHYDHIGAVAGIKERYAAPFFLHDADAPLLRRANLYRMIFESREAIRVPSVTFNISELAETFEVGPFAVSWMGTPGHTEGSVCLRVENFLFSGDTLMHNIVPRSDLPGGNREHLVGSLRKLMELPGELTVCGGHGGRTTVAAAFSPESPVWSLLR